MTHPEITFVDAESRRTAVVHGTVRVQDVPAFLGSAFEKVAAVVSGQDTHVVGPPFAAYRRSTGAELDVQAGLPVAARITPEGPVVPGTLPGGPTAEIVHIGPYEGLARTYQELDGWLRVRGLRPAPLMWEFYLTDPVDPAHRHPDGPRTLVVQPLEAELPAGADGSARSDPGSAR